MLEETSACALASHASGACCVSLQVFVDISSCQVETLEQFRVLSLEGHGPCPALLMIHSAALFTLHWLWFMHIICFLFSSHFTSAHSFLMNRAPQSWFMPLSPELVCVHHSHDTCSPHTRPPPPVLFIYTSAGKYRIL